MTTKFLYGSKNQLTQQRHYSQGLRDAEIFFSFPDNPTLQNIVNGIIADKKVNVDKCIQFGQEIINKYAGHPVFTYECSQKCSQNVQPHRITT